MNRSFCLYFSFWVGIVAIKLFIAFAGILFQLKVLSTLLSPMKSVHLILTIFLSNFLFLTKLHVKIKLTVGKVSNVSAHIVCTIVNNFLSARSKIVGHVV